MPANNTPEGDFIEQDRNDDNKWCEHGVFVGNDYGGDYLCHWCEIGEDPPEDFASERAAQPDGAISLVTDAALEYANLLARQGDDWALTSAMELRAAVAEIDAQRTTGIVPATGPAADRINAIAIEWKKNHP